MRRRRGHLKTTCTLGIRAFFPSPPWQPPPLGYFHLLPQRRPPVGLVHTFALLRPLPSWQPSPLCWTHEGISLPYEPLLGGPLVLFISKNRREISACIIQVLGFHSIQTTSNALLGIHEHTCSLQSLFSPSTETKVLFLSCPWLPS